MSKTIQTRVYPATLDAVKSEVLRRRKEGKFQPPLDTPASVIRDAVNLLLEDDEDPTIGVTLDEICTVPPIMRGIKSQEIK